MTYKKPNYFILFLKRFLFMVFLFPFYWLFLSILVFIRCLITLDTFEIYFNKYIEIVEFEEDE